MGPLYPNHSCSTVPFTHYRYIKWIYMAEIASRGLQWSPLESVLVILVTWWWQFSIHLYDCLLDWDHGMTLILHNWIVPSFKQFIKVYLIINTNTYYKLQIFCNADLFSKRRRRFSSREFQSFPQIFLRKHKKTEMILASWWKNLEIREKKTFVSFSKRDAGLFLLQKNSNL